MLGAAGLGMVGCAGTKEEARQEKDAADRVDDSFARMLVDAATGDALDRDQALRHRALDVLLRHRRLSGDLEATKQSILDGCIAALRARRPTGRPLDAWSSRHAELLSCADEAAQRLPAGVTFKGRIYLVAGYDIGVAAPPDIALNVHHTSFERDPEEMCFYAAHEAHHVGYMSLRSMPSMRTLEQPNALFSLVRYMTQMEGMGVHAAYALRVQRGALGHDPDYAIYADLDVRKHVCERYGQAILGLRGRAAAALLGPVLEAMSSGERLWYRMGALAAWTLEQAHGKQALIESIDQPSLFDETVDRLVKSGGKV
jgi:hypothetical protein